MTLGLDLDYLERSARGEFDLGWLRDTGSEWGVRAVPSKTGLTLRDIAIGSYGEVPDHAPLRTMAPRGSDVEPGVPDMGYTINDRAEVWADNVLDLYEEAVSRQWSATRDIPWADLAPLDPDVEHAMCQLATVLSEVEMVAADFPAKWLWRINHDFVEAKMFLCTQVMDEARHTEVFARYIDEKVGEAYPMNPHLEAQITGLLEDGRWDIAYLGMQIVIESLALSAFGDMARRTEEPLLRKLLRYVMADEARHVAFGILSLGEYYEHLSSAELKDRQDFLLEHTLHARARSTTPEVWERLGVPIGDVAPFIAEAAASMDTSPFQGFQNGFFSKLVPNVKRLGLLDANDGYLRERWGAAGLLRFEFAEDTAADYDSYDAVAADRAGVEA